MCKLEIVIPALNEEKSIEKIILRSLDARDAIIRTTFIDKVAITVVSDGSTDNTVTIAKKFTNEINLIVFKKNKGYGAAIKEGWRQSDADLLSFLDADGTCDPLFFIELCQLLKNKNVDIVLGSRLNKHSEMPLIRKLGNIIFSTLLSLISSIKITDTASGMRVIKSSVLERIMPLPDGLHFTPAMSARAILSNDLTIAEIDMPYKEREGTSKLNVIKDGIRFLRIILSTAFLYKPNILFNFLAITLAFLSIILMFNPFFFYMNNSFVEEWMIYRFIISSLAMIMSGLALISSSITERIVHLTLFEVEKEYKYSLVYKFFSSKIIWYVCGIMVFAGVGMIYDSVVERVTTGYTFEHWSRYIASSTLLILAAVFLLFKGINYSLSKIKTRLVYFKNDK